MFNQEGHKLITCGVTMLLSTNGRPLCKTFPKMIADPHDHYSDYTHDQRANTDNKHFM
jgi:hypothetical protein